ncbi:MAG TPA: hypothetical protein PK926_08410 [Spirochaetota bacterium]|nr:hypothetical protein [Spirochaetota bacterium]HPI89851.1 hypothetical protein [Spirochaetota bacterium]HPR48636.1 hypothetical protein [Spirochaetota bacterium]
MINQTGKITMKLKEEDLEKIGKYVQQRLPEWLETIPSPMSVYNRDIELRERVVRVEEELKNQRELMKKGFELMEKRFDDMHQEMNRRFEQVDRRLDQIDRRFESFEKRFSRITVLITAGFAMVTILISVYRFLT